MEYQTINNSTIYQDTRYDFLLKLEETGTPNLSPYVDDVGLPTIGAGFNLTEVSVREQVFATLDIGQFGLSYSSLGSIAQAAEDSYVSQLVSVINGSYYNASDNAVLQNLLNSIMTQRANDPLIPYAVDFSFDFDNQNEVRTTFDEIMRLEYEEIVTDWLEQVVGIQNIPNSNERLVLLSLAYNSKVNPGQRFPSLLGSGLASALRNDNRAEAWYEIRYNSNKDSLLASPPSIAGGIAKRRYYESELFGLYDADVDDLSISENEAREVYRMFSDNRQQILNYENSYGGNQTGTNNRINTANNDYGLPASEQVQTLENSFQLSFDYLIQNYVTDALNGFNPVIDYRDIQVADDTGETLTGTQRQDYQLGSGQEVNDLLIGGAGSDILLGNGGSDVLRGGDGSDWIEGGDGNDFIFGGNDDSADTLLGDGGDDFIEGGLGNDWLEGGADDDQLFGEAGDDDIYGDGGNDQLYGGTGSDGIDTYTLSGNSTTTITDTGLIDFDTYIISEAANATITDSDGDETYRISGSGDITLTRSSPIIITDNDNGATIELANFNDGDFGIQLVDAVEDILAFEKVLAA